MSLSVCSFQYLTSSTHSSILSSSLFFHPSFHSLLSDLLFTLPVHSLVSLSTGLPLSAYALLVQPPVPLSSCALPVDSSRSLFPATLSVHSLLPFFPITLSFFFYSSFPLFYFHLHFHIFLPLSDRLFFPHVPHFLSVHFSFSLIPFTSPSRSLLSLFQSSVPILSLFPLILSTLLSSTHSSTLPFLPLFPFTPLFHYLVPPFHLTPFFIPFHPFLSTDGLARG